MCDVVSMTTRSMLKLFRIQLIAAMERIGPVRWKNHILQKFLHFTTGSRIKPGEPYRAEFYRDLQRVKNAEYHAIVLRKLPDFR